jgi:hypothetical protein
VASNHLEDLLGSEIVMGVFNRVSNRRRRVLGGAIAAVITLVAVAGPASAGAARELPAGTLGPDGRLDFELGSRAGPDAPRRGRPLAETSGAFVYRKGRYTPLSAIPGATTGSIHFDINNRGEVAGSFFDAGPGDDGLPQPGSVHGFVKDRRGKVTTFDVPGAATTTGWGINNRGQVVGLYTDPGAVPGPAGEISSDKGHLFVRDRDGRITTVDVPFPNLRGIGDINDRGQFVGTYIDAAGGVRGFRREPDGRFTAIDVPGAGTLPLGINKQGQVVGIYADEGTVNNPDGSYPRYRVHGFLWDDGRVTKIDVPGSVLTYAFGVNKRGQITGGYYDTTGTQHGFVFERGRYRTIAPPGRTENTAWGINDRGDIVVPEPTTRLITVASE